MGHKAKTHVIGGPLLLAVAENWPQHVDDGLSHLCSAVVRHGVQNAFRERVEPAANSRRQRGQPRKQSNVVHAKAVPFESCSILWGGGKIPGHVDRTAVLLERDAQRQHDRTGVAMPSQLGDKTPVRFQGPMHAGKNRVVRANPVQHRIGKDCVELVIERQFSNVHQTGIDAASSRRGHHLWRRIDPQNRGAPRDDLGRQRAVTAPKIEDPFAFLWIQEVDQRRTVRGHESGVPGIFVGLPPLGGDGHEDLELQNEAGADATEIELRIGDRQSEDFHVLKGMKVPDVSPNSNVTSQK
jgi:hypothetical protein